MKLLKLKEIKILLSIFLIIAILITGCSKIQGDNELGKETGQTEEQIEEIREDEEVEEVVEDKDRERGERYYLKKNTKNYLTL